MAVTRGRYGARMDNKKSRVYIFLSIVIVVVMVRWGVPAMINLIGSASTGNTTKTEDADTIPPQTPILSALPEATNSGLVIVEGYTEAKANVSFWVNDQMVESMVAGDDGSFSQKINLKDGGNTLRVKAMDESQNESWSTTKGINVDKKPVELIVESPSDGTEFFGKNSRPVEIKGKVNKADATITVNGSYTQVDAKGEFLHRYLLNDGDNQLTVRAIDKAGNQSEKVLVLKYIP